MRISVAIGALPGYPLCSTLAIASEAHADGVELLLSSGMSATNPLATQQLADEVNIPITSLHAVLRFRSTTFDRKLADDCASIRFAAGLRDCAVVVLHPPLTGARPSAQLNRWLADIVSERDRTRPDLRLALENRAQNHDGVERQLLDDLSTLRSVAGEWDVHLTLDLAHAASWGTHVTDAVDTVMSRLVNLHLSDSRSSTMRGGIRNGLYRDHLLPGDGYLPIDEVIHRLTQHAYDGQITIELSPVSLRAWWPPSARRRLREAVNTVRAMSRVAPPVDHHDVAQKRTARSPER